MVPVKIRSQFFRCRYSYYSVSAGRIVRDEIFCYKLVTVVCVLCRILADSSFDNVFWQESNTFKFDVCYNSFTVERDLIKDSIW